MALTMQLLEPSSDFNFWKTLSMPDIHLLEAGSDKGT